MTAQGIGIEWEFRSRAMPKGFEVQLEEFESPAQAADLAHALRMLAEQCEQKAREMQAAGVAPAETKAADQWLTAEEAAPRLGLTVEQLQRRRWPFRKKLGHRTVRYSAAGIARYLERRGG